MAFIVHVIGPENTGLICKIYFIDIDICNLILENLPNCHTRPIPFLLTQLMATLVLHSAITRLS